MQKIIVKPGTLNEAIEIEKNIPEFKTPKLEKEFSSRAENFDPLILIGYIDSKPVGCLVGYDHYHDGSYYCWVACVLPEYRSLGIFKQMMEFENDWAKSKGYKTIKIKTRNKFRAMLSYLLKNNYNFTDVEKVEDILEYRIYLEKSFIS